MKILVLENNLKELSVIQQALDSNKYTLAHIASSQQAWIPLQSGEARFLIANWDTSDLKETEFIPRIRAARLPTPIYILLTTSSHMDEEFAPAQADDIIHLPLKAAELKNRVAIAERILALSSNLAQAREQLETGAVFDALTSFMNRAAFLRQSYGEMERARRASLPLSIIALDIDNFKLINDRFGSAVGDDVLRMVAQGIREKSRPYDCIARWSGDQFIILIGGVIGADAEKIAQRILAGVRGTEIEVQNEAPLQVKVSAGIASAARVGTTTEVEQLVQQAQQAVRRAKESGGDQVYFSYV